MCKTQKECVRKKPEEERARLKDPIVEQVDTGSKIMSSLLA